MKKFAIFALMGLVGAASMMAQIPQSKLDANSLALGVRGTGGLPPEVIMAHGVIDPSGNLLINTKTGVVAIAANATIGGSSVVALGTITSTSAHAFAVGPNGITNPAFNIDDSGTTPQTGLNILPAVAGSGLALSVISSGTNESVTFDAKGSGTITFNATATGGVVFGHGALGTSPTLGVGYGTGAGGAVTQASSRTTGVTLSKVTGAITLVSAAGSATAATFTVTNTTVAATDTVVISQKSGTDAYTATISAVGAGSFKITIVDLTGTTTEQPVFNFCVIKGSAS